MNLLFHRKAIDLKAEGRLTRFAIALTADQRPILLHA